MEIVDQARDLFQSDSSDQVGLRRTLSCPVCLCLTSTSSELHVYNLKKRKIQRLFPDIFSALTLNEKNIDDVLAALQTYMRSGDNAKERFEAVQENETITAFLPKKALEEFSYREEISEQLIVDAAGGDLEGVTSELWQVWEKDGVWVNAADEKGRTALHKAVVHGPDIVKLLLENDADVNAVDYFGKTPLLKLVYDATFKRKKQNLVPSMFKVVPLLLKRGADINAADIRGRTALRWVEDLAVAEFLLDNGADASAVDEDGNTPLLEAATTVDVPLAKLLLGHGAKLNNEKGTQTPLIKAIARQAYSSGGPARRQQLLLEFVPLLLKYGADINAVDEKGRTALDWAIERKYTQLEKLLREYGENHK